ncbi:GAF domain-containing sensor histidine kinase [Sphingobacterium sp.]|uniref:GAF domain-containing sensor histidine kinase n=1 Tax=Sphingobacterium sp. TaxID=341027 RepID=UPI0031DD4599
MTFQNKINQRNKKYTDVGAINASQRILETMCSHIQMRYGLIRKKRGDKWDNCCVYDYHSQQVIIQDSDTYVKIYQEIRKGFEPIYIDNVDRCTKQQWGELLQEFGLKSYISYPILNKNNRIVGHLSFMNDEPVEFDRSKLETLFPFCSDLIATDFSTTTETLHLKNILEQERMYSKNRDLILFSLAHDLNNPVSIIKLLSQYLGQHLENGTQKILAKKIENTSSRMKGVIDDILDFSNTRFGREGESHTELVNMEQLIKQVLSEFEVIHDKTVLTNMRLPLNVHSDKNKMGRAFVNLISNAIKHGAPHKEIEINAFIEKDNFIFSVTNYFSATRLPNTSDLFKPFLRGSGSKGLGLGLYVTKEIAKFHHGDIEVVIEDTKITFKLLIPVK